VNPLSTERLSQLITAKHEVLTQLRALADRQFEALASDDVDRLLTILAQKQKLLNQLQGLERLIDPFRQQDPESRAWPSPQARRECQLLADRASVLLTEIVALEQAASAKAVETRNQTAMQLAEVNSALAAREAYVSPPGMAHGGLDLLSET
jgi:flagellar biosynthesis/type III secretory pathway chaperone